MRVPTSETVSPSTSTQMTSPFGDFCFEKLSPPQWRCEPEFHRMAELHYYGQLESERKELADELGQHEADRLICKYQKNYAAFKAKCCGQPSWLVLGTARNGAVHHHEREILEAFGRFAGQLGLGNVNGWADTGIMGVGSRSQVRGWQNDFSRACKAPLIGVPLKFRMHTTEVPFQASKFIEAQWGQDPEQLKKAVWIAPKHGFIQTRTTLGLFGLTEVCATIFCRGGLGTDEEAATDSLGRQLRDAIYTHYSDFRPDCVPPRIWLDSPCDGQWFMDGKLQHTRVQLRTGCTGRSDVENIHVIRIARSRKRRRNWRDLRDAGIKIEYFPNAEAAAIYMMRLAIRSYSALQRCYAENA